MLRNPLLPFSHNAKRRWGNDTSHHQIHSISQDEVLGTKSHILTSRAEGPKAGPKVCHLKVQTWRAPRLLVYIEKILKIEKRKILSKSIFHKSRGEREIFLQNLENREEKENFNKRSWETRGEREFLFSKSWNSRGERDMKIHFSSLRGKTVSHFSSRISRDRDSCQCLEPRMQWWEVH